MLYTYTTYIGIIMAVNIGYIFMSGRKNLGSDKDRNNEYGNSLLGLLKDLATEKIQDLANKKTEVLREISSYIADLDYALKSEKLKAKDEGALLTIQTQLKDKETLVNNKTQRRINKIKRENKKLHINKIAFISTFQCLILLLLAAYGYDHPEKDIYLSAFFVNLMCSLGILCTLIAESDLEPIIGKWKNSTFQNTFSKACRIGYPNWKILFFTSATFLISVLLLFWEWAYNTIPIGTISADCHILLSIITITIPFILYSIVFVCRQEKHIYLYKKGIKLLNLENFKEDMKKLISPYEETIEDIKRTKNATEISSDSFTLKVGYASPTPKDTPSATEN